MDAKDLRPYQKEMVKFIYETPRCNVWAFMGLGKTVSVATAIDLLYETGTESMPTLIIAPPQVAYVSWPSEFRKWNHLCSYEIASLNLSQKQRSKLLLKDSAFTAVSYELLPWLVAFYEDSGKTWPFGIVVADESTRLKSTRSKGGGTRGRAILKVAHSHVKRWINLTGTPCANGLADLWGQQFFIDEGKRLGKSYAAYMRQWFFPRMHYNGIPIDYQPVAGSIEAIRNKLSDCTIVVDSKAILGVDEPVVNVVYVDLPASAFQIYRAVERKLVAEINGETKFVLSAASKLNTCLQIASGAVYMGEEKDGRWGNIHDEKIKALESIIEESAGAPIIVAYHFKIDLERLKKHFKGIDARDGDNIIEDWNAGKIPLLFLHPMSGGYGLNLQFGGNIMVFFTTWWSLETYQQTVERIGPVRQKQAGFNRPVYIYHIVARNTVDEDVVQSLKDKRSVQDSVLAGVNRRNRNEY